MNKINGSVNVGAPAAKAATVQTLDINQEISNVAKKAMTFLSTVRTSVELKITTLLNTIKSLPESHPLKKIYNFFQEIFAPKTPSMKPVVKQAVVVKQAAVVKYKVDEDAVSLLGINKKSVLSADNIEMMKKVVEDDKNGCAAFMLGLHYEKQNDFENALHFYGVSLDEKYYPGFGIAVDTILEQVPSKELTQERLFALKRALREAEGAGIELGDRLFPAIDQRLNSL